MKVPFESKISLLTHFTHYFSLYAGLGVDNPEQFVMITGSYQDRQTILQKIYIFLFE